MEIPKIIQDFYSDIRGNLKWDIFKFVLFRLVPIGGGAIMFVALTLSLFLWYVGYDKYLLNWVIVGGLFLLALVFIALSFMWGLLNRGVVTSTDNAIRSTIGATPDVSAIVKIVRGDLKASEDRVKRRDATIIDLKAKIKRLEEKVEREQSARSEIKEEWNRFFRVVSLAKDQQQKIAKYVLLERFYYVGVDTSAAPILILYAEIKNRSFFEVELSSDIGGIIEFDTMKLRGKYFIDTGVTEPASSRKYRIEVEISDSQKVFMETFSKENNIAPERALKVHSLILSIKGVNDVDEINPKQLIIRPGFKSISYREYDRTLEKFGQ